MNTEKDDLLVYDEEEAVKFIRKNNPGLSLSDDEINNKLDEYDKKIGNTSG